MNFQLSEKGKPYVDIQGLTASTMEILLDFVYTETVHVTVENVQELLPAACLLQLKGTVHKMCPYSWLICPGSVFYWCRINQETFRDPSRSMTFESWSMKDQVYLRTMQKKLSKYEYLALVKETFKLFLFVKIWKSQVWWLTAVI